jgi:endonuclease G
MPRVLLLLLLLCAATSFAPPGTTIVTHHTQAYRLWYDQSTHVPALAAWKLYKGGGTCDRSKFSFRVGKVSAGNRDYRKSGYDEGHMVNAEDFAGDCALEQTTFSYYNCAPQRPALNRGVWAKYEGLARAFSQDDSLFIACGPVYAQQPATMGRVVVPAAYWKAVQSLTTGRVVYCLLFTNTDVPVVQVLDTAQVQRYCPVRIPFKKM